MSDELKPESSSEEVTPDSTNDPLPSGAEQQAPPAAPVNDTETDQAVDDIVQTEADALLTQQDDAVAAAEGLVQQPRRNFFMRWWRSKKARWATVLLILAAIGVLAGLPTPRYWILNTAGVRVTASLTVADSLTGQPLKNVQVRIGDSTAKTDALGKARVVQLKLGPQHIALQRSGFAPFADDITLGWGSNPLGNHPLKAVGMQYKLTIRDALTNVPIQGAEASNGEAVALSDKDGNAVLTLTGSTSDDVTLVVSKDGFRSAKIVVAAQTSTTTDVRLLTARRAVFVTHDSGKYDVYSSDVDGQNRKLVLAGTGAENANLALVVSPSGDHAALLSTRDNHRDAGGFLLTTLTLIDLQDNSTVTLAHAEQLQLVDWIGTRLIFEQVGADSSSAANRYAVIGYDYANTSRVQLAAAKHLNTVLSAHGAIYYAVAADSSDATVQGGLYRINPDASNKQTVLDKEAWTTYRVNYGTLDVQTADGWYGVNLSNSSSATVAAPAAYVSRSYADNTDGSRSLWVDTANGALVVYGAKDAKDTIAHTQGGMAYPVRWLTSDIALYRVVTGSETADYVISTLGNGQPVKVADVVNTFGFTQGQ